MISPLTTLLFGNYRIATAKAGRSKYAHTFGGPPDRKGTSRKDCKGILIHLLHRLDLTDPAIPVAIPGVRWLPLYYCFDYRANDLGYRLVSDDALVTYFPKGDRNVTKEESWPDDDFPQEFPKAGIRIAAQDYDPTQLSDALTWCGIFGIGKLSKANQAAARKRVVRDCKRFGMDVPKSNQEFQEAFSTPPFIQGRPNNPCLNPRCPNRNTNGQLSVIAMMPAEPVKGVHTFGRWGGGTELIFEMCPRCYTIRVSNQCG